MKRLNFLATLTLSVMAVAIPTATANHVNASSGLLIEGGPLAMHGYDTVAYFTEIKPVRGSHEFTVLYDGAVYKFSSAANKKAFEKDPAKYVPAYGGYCAYGVAVGAKFDGDPYVWKIVDGRLYLNLNTEIQKKWEEDVAGNVAKADGNWKRIKDIPASEIK